MLTTLLISILVVVLIILVIIEISSTYSNAPLSTPSTDSSFLGFCSSEKKCSAGYECDLLINQCKLGINKPCFHKDDCMTDLRCSGICIDKNTNSFFNTEKFGDYCPCKDKYVCVNFRNDKVNLGKKCLKPPGIICSDSEECTSNICASNKCQPPGGSGHVCEYDFQCASSNCSLGFCQPPGKITTQDESFCNLTTQNSKACLSFCSLENKCTNVISGLSQTCGAATCSNNLECYYYKDSVLNQQQTTEENIEKAVNGIGRLICSYGGNESGPTPNKPANAKNCPSGSVVNVGGNQCLALSDKPCFSNDNCENNSCLTGIFYNTRIFRLKFTPDNGMTSTGTNGITSIQNPLGTTDSEWIILPKHPTFGKDMIVKIVSITIKGKDSIYILTNSIDNEGDVYTIIYNYNSGKWTTVVSGPVFTVNDSSGNTIKNSGNNTLFTITSFDMMNGKIYVSMMNASTGNSILGQISATGVISVYNSPDGIQLLSGVPIKFSDISLKNFSGGVNILLIDNGPTNSGPIKVYHNINPLSGTPTVYKLYNDPSFNPIYKNKGDIVLNYYIPSSVSAPSVPSSSSSSSNFLPVINYIGSIPGSNNKYLKYSKELGPNYPDYSSFVLPPNPSNLTNINVNTFSFSTTMSQNQSCIMVTTINNVNSLSYILNGAVFTLPGYFSNSSLVSQSGINSYVVGSSCS